jgi:TRAP-type mannitol/chloroaromatic compound transport system permease small subunit
LELLDAFRVSWLYWALACSAGGLQWWILKTVQPRGALLALLAVLLLFRHPL